MAALSAPRAARSCARRHTDGVPLAVVSWNVLADSYVFAARYPRADPADLDVRARRARLVARIAELPADVICLQEVESELSALLSREIPGSCCSVLKRGRSEGVEIRVRSPAVLEREHTFAFGDGSGHVAAVAVVHSGDARIAVATTHLKWDAPGTPLARRFGMRQAAELLATLDARAAGIPRVACGDFNVTSDDPVLARFSAAGFRDAYGGHPEAATCVVNGRARRIDFIVHTGEISAEPLPVIALSDSTPLPSAELPSDHAPIAAVFRW